ncbi:UNVERIFIED_CONTAM: hypothetical protein GTU68_045095 [Idotea baltica]|nr:hypothetical protein [Idotea baltica]
MLKQHKDILVIHVTNMDAVQFMNTVYLAVFIQTRNYFSNVYWGK